VTAFGATAKFAAAGACWRCNALSFDAWLQREAIFDCPAQSGWARSGKPQIMLHGTALSALHFPKY
jgi:hypothetical protein